MVNILKILAFPTLVVLPWVILILSNSENSFQNFVTTRPLLLLLLLLPSIIITYRWFFKLFKGQYSHHQN